MKLRGSIASPYVARVVMCARAKGIALEPAEAPGGGAASVADLLPGSSGAMPVLEIDGQSIAEADAICEYLEDAYPERTLRPENLYERARARLLPLCVQVLEEWTMALQRIQAARSQTGQARK